MLSSPLDIFEIIPSYVFTYEDLSFVISNFTLQLYVVLFIICLSFDSALYKPKLPPNRWQSFTEAFYTFLFTTLKQQTGIFGERFFPIIFVLFSFILISNFMSLMPASLPITGQLIVALILSVSLNSGIVLLGFTEQKLSFLKLFSPSGVPIFLLPLVIVIEIASYLLRFLSLGLRLFANIVAGHSLLHIYTGFIVNILFSPLVFLPIIALLIFFAIFGLEFAIAAIQAYVFIVLFCVYLNEALRPTH